MGQYCGKNRFLQPENLRFKLGPMHLLDGHVGEGLALDITT